MRVAAVHEEGYILGVYRLVGGVQIRQVRVSNQSCSERRFVSECINTEVNGTVECVPRFDTKGGVCFAEFVTGVTDDRSPFGPNDKYRWSPNHDELWCVCVHMQTRCFPIPLPLPAAHLR